MDSGDKLGFTQGIQSPFVDRRLFAVLILSVMVTTACPPPPQPTPSSPPSLSPATGYSATCVGLGVTPTLNAGQTGSLQVVCTNTGTNTWTRGTPAEASLVACCPIGGSAPFPAWLANSVRVPQTATTVAPGSYGTFVFNVTVPPGTQSGTYTSYAAPGNAGNHPIPAQGLTPTVN